MKCEVLDILYVKANGEVLCHDDFGERVSLGWVRDEDGFSVDALRGSGPYANIRASFAAGQLPWPGVCDRCAFLRPLETLVDTSPTRRLKTIQIESSLACALACPACSQSQQIRSRPKPHIMEVAVYDRLVRTLASEGYEVGAIEYCGQGEPLLNPRMPQMIALARKSLPKTRHRIITSGNVSYAKAVGGEHVDEMYVSCDGLRQESYEKYRINGSVDSALQFMADTKKADPGSIVIWKYILFEFNDSDQEIIEAQKKAEELGVDSIMFVSTHSAFKSARYTADNLADLPLVSPIARTNLTPIQKKLERQGNQTRREIQPKVSFFRSSRSAAHCIVDELVINSNGVLNARGWAADRSGKLLRSIEASVNGISLGSGKLGQPRGDVLAAYPAFASDRVGFHLSFELPEELRNPPNIQLKLRLTGQSGERDEYVADYQFG